MPWICSNVASRMSHPLHNIRFYIQNMVGVRTFKNQQKCVFAVESPSNTCTSQMRLAHIQWCPSAACRTRPHGENPSRHLYALWNRASGMSSRYVWHVFIICTVHMHLSIVTTSFHSNMCINCWEFMCWPTPEEWIAIPAKKKHPLFGCHCGSESRVVACFLMSFPWIHKAICKREYTALYCIIHMWFRLIVKNRAVRFGRESPAKSLNWTN